MRQIDARDNQLFTLDLTTNDKLLFADLRNNALISLNIANGNNTALSSLNTSGNSGLTCITADVSTPTTGLTGWVKDAPHTFSSTLCLNNLTYVPDDNLEAYLETHDAQRNVVALGSPNSMGNGIANDDYVLTNRINTVANLQVSSLMISEMTGIEDFAALKSLYIESGIR